MLYLFIDKKRVKLLHLKKSMLGQYETSFYEKSHTIELLDDDGNIINVDLMASVIKEAITSSPSVNGKDKDVSLILPKYVFDLLRTETSSDLAVTATDSFLKDKIRTNLNISPDNLIYDYITVRSNGHNEISLIGLSKERYSQINSVFTLLGLRLSSIIPNIFAYYNLFAKTLRKEKKENILYTEYEDNYINGYYFDSYGPLEKKGIHQEIENKKVEQTLKKEVDAFQKEGNKLNRIILSGKSSEGIRQDTFTKNVGVWTNPLIKIVPQFYEEYLKMLVLGHDQNLPILDFDVCIGAFIFSNEEKNFSLLKKRSKMIRPSLPSLPSFSLPKKEILLFASSFILSFILFVAVSGFNFKKIIPTNISLLNPTPTSTPVPSSTPTPTSTAQRKDLKIKVLNGSGIRGKATDVKDLLKQKGYEEILTGNADSFDIEQTEIDIKNESKSFSDTIKKDLSDNVSNPKIKDLSASESADIVITIGKDFK